MALTTSDYLNIANMGTSLFGGLATGKQSERQANESAQDFLLRQQQEAYRQAADAYARRMSARSGIGMALQDQNLARQNARQSTLNASPLGAEQSLAMQMARARGLSTQAEGFRPTVSQDPAIASRMGALPNVLGAFTTADYRNTISPEATARSIAERRKAIGGVDPDFQFGNMGDYGLPNLGGEVSSYQNKIGADRLGRENQLMQLLTNQMEEASKPLYQDPGAASSFGPAAPTAPVEEKKKGSPWWKKVLKVAAAAAPIVAAPFTGGTSLALIGAGAGALGGALDGGKKGALTGGLMGGLTGGFAGGPTSGFVAGAPGAIIGGAAGNAAKRVAGESVKSALQRAIINPRALATIGGSAASAFGGDSAVGKLGTAAQAISPFLRGVRPGMVAGFENQMPQGWQGPQQLPESLGPGMTGFDTNFNSPAPSLASTRAPQFIAPQGANLQSMGIGNGRPVPSGGPGGQAPPVRQPSLMRGLQIPTSQYGLLGNNAFDLGGADFSGFDANTRVVQERTRRAPVPYSGFESAKVGGLPPQLETNAQRAAFAIPMAVGFGTGAAQLPFVGAGMGATTNAAKKAWTYMNTSPAARAAQQAGPNAARDASWAAQAASRAPGAASQAASRSANTQSGAARVAEAVRGQAASGSRAPSGGFRPPVRPRVVEGPSQVFGPRGPQGNALDEQQMIAQMLKAYQQHLAQGNTAYAQQVLNMMQPFLKGAR